MKRGVNVYSEIGKLNKVLLHRLDREVEGLVPDNFERLLFDDIPYLKGAQAEHDRFAEVLSDNGVEVVYFVDEAAKALSDKKVREQFIKEFIAESNILSPFAQEAIEDYLKKLKAKELVETVIAGIKKSELDVKAPNSLAAISMLEYPYYTDPLPNLYFTRDPGACIGKGLCINRMSTAARSRETLLLKYMADYDPDLFPAETPHWYDREEADCIEGGDILVLSKEIVAIGLSERTTCEAIDAVASRLLTKEGFKKIVVFDIPKCRAFMHLDTVFAMLDYDKFSIHPEVEGPLRLYEITAGKGGELKYTSVTDTLTNLLKLELKLPVVQMIRCGGTDSMASQREQWSDGANLLAVAPGVIISYDRNYITNEIMSNYGIKVLSIPSSEMSRGRGGPRCMAMPINRD